MKIKIGFSRAIGFKPFSWAIQLWEGTNFSHTYIEFYSEEFQQTLIIQASHGMVNVMTKDRFLKINKVVEEFELDIYKPEMFAAIRYAGQHLGKKYSLASIMLIVLKRLGIKTKRLKDDSRRFHCSELVYVAFKDKLQLNYFDPDLITPKEVYNELRRLYGIRK
jgi:hypothetical protein